MKEASFVPRPFVPLILLPFVVVNVLRDRASIRGPSILAAGLAGAKAALGLIEIAVGMGYGAPGGSSDRVPRADRELVCIAVVLVLIARLMQRRSMPLWLIVISLISIGRTPSYRRSVWIAAVLGLLIVLLVGLQRRRWLNMIPGFVAVVSRFGCRSVPDHRRRGRTDRRTGGIADPGRDRKQRRGPIPDRRASQRDCATEDRIR